MSDRFRFRAWDKVRGQYEDCKVYLNTNGKLIGFYGRDERLDGFYIVEQCTGLKDKNGKLIYEGDIVEIIDQENLNTLDRIYPMLFNEKVAKFGYKHPDGHFFYHSNNDDYSYEVIGNIHENPELINENH